MSVSVSVSVEEVTRTVAEILEELTADWDLDLDGGLTGESRLVGDLGFSSVDFVELAVAIEEKFNKPELGFDELMMVQGKRVEDLSVAEIARFVDERLRDK